MTFERKYGINHAIKFNCLKEVKDWQARNNVADNLEQLAAMENPTLFLIALWSNGRMYGAVSHNEKLLTQEDMARQLNHEDVAPQLMDPEFMTVFFGNEGKYAAMLTNGSKLRYFSGCYKGEGLEMSEGTRTAVSRLIRLNMDNLKVSLSTILYFAEGKQ